MENFFRFGSGQVHFQDNGKGEVIILLHGYLETSGIWKDFTRRLSPGFRVIAPDLPGHGKSDIPGAICTMELMATMIKELIDELGIEKIFLAGHSLGGYIALAFLELFPERLSGYCLFHSHPFADTTEAINKRIREIKIVESGKKDLMYPDNVVRMFAEINLGKFTQALTRSREIASQISAQGIISVLKGMIARPSRLNAMQEGVVPCLWILGSMDNYIPADAIQQKVKLPVNARVVILENSGHLGFIEEEERAAKVIAEFVNNLKW